jgi:hypothetical protein
MNEAGDLPRSPSRPLEVATGSDRILQSEGLKFLAVAPLRFANARKLAA